MSRPTTLKVEQVETDLFTLQLGTETLGHYASAEAAENYRLLAATSTEHLYDLVNERVELLQKSENHLASVIRAKLARLHQARRIEIGRQLERGFEVFVEFEYEGLHWETIVTFDHDEEGSREPSVDAAFFFAQDPLGVWTDATDFTSNFSDGAFEALVDAAIEEAR